MSLFSYYLSLPGPYHIKNNIPCQDACHIECPINDMMVAAIADGLGSAAHSDIASKLAVKTVSTYCITHATGVMPDEERYSHMKDAFFEAYRTIEDAAEKAGHPIKQYDTTLCVAIYDGNTLYYGQSGDSGIIAHFMDGHYEQVTTKQQDDLGRVFPLRFGPQYWKFGKATNIACIMLATDGVLDHIFHPLLKKESVPLDVPLAGIFMDHYNIEASEIPELIKDLYSFLRDYPEKYINDDKSIVVLMNQSLNPKRQPDSYYDPPQWERIYRELEKERTTLSSSPYTDQKKGGALYDCIYKIWRKNHPDRTRTGFWWRRKGL